MTNIIELLPLAFFYYFYLQYDIYYATSALISSTAIILAYFHLRQGKIKKSQWVLSGIVIALGSITVLLRDPIYIMWKPTIVNSIIAMILLGGPMFFNKYPLKLIIPKDIAAFNNGIWKTIHLTWGVFLSGMAALNTYVAHTMTMDEWVNFKVLFSPILTLIMSILTLVVVKTMITKQLNKEAKQSESKQCNAQSESSLKAKTLKHANPTLNEKTKGEK